MYLLDTHVLIWFTGKTPLLPIKIRELIEQSSDVFVSIASFWEMTIKISKGRLLLPHSIADLIKICEDEWGFSMLDIRANHLYVLKDLKWFHKDPFDRMLISQALSEDMTLITADKLLKAYPVKQLWQE